MTDQSTTVDSIREYLPATLGPSAVVAAIQRRLTAPYRRTYDIWMAEKNA